jgi:hypothetical protein
MSVSVVAGPRNHCEKPPTTGGIFFSGGSDGTKWLRMPWPPKIR